MNNAEQPQSNYAKLKATAQAYWEQGLAVVPFIIGSDGKKRPAVDSWKQLQSRPQTNEEFKALNKQKLKLGRC